MIKSFVEVFPVEVRFYAQHRPFAGAAQVAFRDADQAGVAAHVPSVGATSRALQDAGCSAVLMGVPGH